MEKESRERTRDYLCTYYRPGVTCRPWPLLSRSWPWCPIQSFPQFQDFQMPLANWKWFCPLKSVNPGLHLHVFALLPSVVSICTNVILNLFMLYICFILCLYDSNFCFILRGTTIFQTCFNFPFVTLGLISLIKPQGVNNILY